MGDLTISYLRAEKEKNMSDEILGEVAEPNVEPEIGSGEISNEAIEDSGLAQEADGVALDELAGDIEAAVEEGATDEEIKELVETFKFKANGQEKEVTLDWNNKEDIIRRLQLAEAAQPAMQKASEIEKNYEREIQNLLDNPWEVLKELGLDPDEMAEARIQQQIEQLQKSPEQLEFEKQQNELEELRNKLKVEEEAKSEQEFARLQREAEIDLDQQITAALSSTTELPKSPYVVKRIADAMLTALENGYNDVKAEDVIPWVEKEINSEFQELFAAMPDKSFENYIGQKNIERLRKGRLNKMQAASQIKESGKAAPVEKKAEKKLKLNDWLKHGSSLKDL